MAAELPPGAGSAGGIAGVVVTGLLIPQSLSYAMLAGLPPHIGLYASILPLLAYAAFGSSMTLSVGPVAVASLIMQEYCLRMEQSPQG